MQAPSRIFLALGVIATVAYYRLPVGGETIAGDVVALVAVAAMLVGVAWHRPEPQVAYVLLGFGVLCLAVGDVVFGSGQSVPSPADVLYISAYPLLALGLVGLRSWTGIRSVRRTVGVAGMVAGLVGVVSWTFLVLPAGHAHQTTAVTKIVALGYPAMDVVLLLLIVRAVLPQDRVPAALKLFGTGMALMLAADTAYALDNFGNAYHLGSIVDAVWLLSYVFFASALLHPTVREDVLVRPECGPRHASTDVHVGVGKHSALREAVAQDLRFEIVVTWSGRMLVALGFTAMCLAAKWKAPQVALLASAYSMTGLLMWFAGSRRMFAS